MATAKQIAANRRNGSLARGPKTSAGKARSSRNALKHGLSIPVNRDKSLRRQIEVLARILAQSEAGNVFGQAWAAEYVFAGKSDQLWNVIPVSIQTPQQIQAYTERLQRNLNSRDRLVRYLSARTLEALVEGNNTKLRREHRGSSSG
jgi:hypothetical protein